MSAVRNEFMGSMQQFPGRQLSSWRHEDVHIPPYSLKTVSFLDTTPNMFYVQNPNGVKLKVGITSMPSDDSYEFIVGENSVKTFGRPTPANQVYFLNNSGSEVVIKLFSIYDKFDMNILQETAIDLSGASFAGFDGIIRGFNAPLPSGTNMIGKVSFDGVIPLPSATTNAMVTTAENMETLTADEEFSGKINLYTLWKKVNEIQTGQAEILSNILAKLDNVGASMFSNMSFEHGENLIDTMEIDLSGMGANHISFISNDSSCDIVVTVYLTEYNFTSVILKENDSLADMDLPVFKVTVAAKNAGDTFAFRCLVARRG